MGLKLAEIYLQLPPLLVGFTHLSLSQKVLIRKFISVNRDINKFYLKVTNIKNIHKTMYNICMEFE